jgi:probable blue pigment (indigoidine) exporter
MMHAAPGGDALTGRPPPLRMLWITAAFGSCFLLVRWGLRDAPLLWFAALRALVGGGALALLAIRQHRPLPRGARTLASLSLLGLVNVTLAFVTMFAGIAGLATGTAAVLANAQPLLILLPAWWLYGEHLSGRTVGSLLVGFLGLIVVALPGGGGQGALLSLLSAVAVTAGTLLVRLLHRVDLVAAAAAQFLIGGVTLSAVAIVADGPPDIHWTVRFAAVLGFLSLVATAASTVAWFIEAQRCSLSALTAWLFLVPVFGLLLGVIVLDERPAGWTLLGVGLILASMWTALTTRPVSPPAEHVSTPGVGRTSR